VRRSSMATPRRVRDALTIYTIYLKFFTHSTSCRLAAHETNHHKTTNPTVPQVQSDCKDKLGLTKYLFFILGLGVKEKQL